jgi:tRNA pseudouridine55 synthase
MAVRPPQGTLPGMTHTPCGLLVIDKPAGMTSRAVVNQVQQWFARGVKIGHTGTLDPLATGVLVLCVGRATRLADYVQQGEKTYQSRFRLGAVSDTDDAQGLITPRQGVSPPLPEQLQEVLQEFVGDVWQRPPAFSALKLQGQRAHALARQGAAPSLAPRLVHIRAIRLRDYQWPYVDVEVECSRGTYIRALARDVGEKLGCGGYVETLRRLRVGPFTLDQAIPLEQLREPPPLWPARLAVAHLPTLTLDQAEAQRFRRGQFLLCRRRSPADASVARSASENRGDSQTPGASPMRSELQTPDDLEWAVLDLEGNLLGIGKRVGVSLRPWIVL